jgi:N-acetylglucosaminyl-diphospho-decaprenol L-rhamnosyltransferase
VDVCLRLHQTGWKVVLDPSVAIFHREGGSTRHAPFRKVVNHHRSALRFYCRYHRGDPWLLFAPVVALGLVLRALASLVRTGIGRVRGKWVVGRS